MTPPLLQREEILKEEDSGEPTLWSFILLGSKSILMTCLCLVILQTVREAGATPEGRGEGEGDGGKKRQRRAHNRIQVQVQ